VDAPRPLTLESWLAALERRHLADLTASELARALRALSSCYVERRAKLASGGALDTSGKRAAFALFYAPLHFLVTREIVRAIPAAHASAITEILDLGCGTGVAGAAWALECGGAHVRGIDRHPWAVTEANWTYRELAVSGRAVQGDAARVPLPSGARAGILAAYTINELPEPTRGALLPRLLDAHARGACVLVIEPIARRLAPWWDRWQGEFDSAGGEAAEWRFSIPLPDLQRRLGRAAGLDPRDLAARSLWLGRSR
jgi:SAM-dependent methyltransferase